MTSPFYSATKHFNRVFSDSLNLINQEKAPYIQTTALCPGVAATQMTNFSKSRLKSCHPKETAVGSIRDTFGLMNRSYGSFKHSVQGLQIEWTPKALRDAQK